MAEQEMEIVDGRPSSAWGTLYRADVIAPGADELTRYSWRVLALLITYCSGSPDGYRVDRRRIQTETRIKPRRISEALAQLRALGFIQSYRRCLPRTLPGSSQWAVGPSSTDEFLDVEDGLELGHRHEIRSPHGNYPDGPDDVITHVVDRDDARPGRYRLLRVIARKRLPGAPAGRLRQVGATLEQLVEHGYGCGADGRVRKLSELTLGQLLAGGYDLKTLQVCKVVPVDPNDTAPETCRVRVARSGTTPAQIEHLRGGAMPPPSGGAMPPPRVALCRHPRVALCRHPSKDQDPVSITGIDGTPSPLFGSESGSGKRYGGSGKRYGPDGPDQDGGLPASLGRQELEAVAPLGGEHRGVAPSPRRAESWRHLCAAALRAAGLLVGRRRLTWRQVLTRDPAAVHEIGDVLRSPAGKRWVTDKVRQVGPYSVSEAVTEVLRAWLSGGVELPVAVQLDPWPSATSEVADQSATHRWILESMEVDPADPPLTPAQRRSQLSGIRASLRGVPAVARWDRSLETLDQATAAGRAASLLGHADELELLELEAADRFDDGELLAWEAWEAWEAAARRVLAVTLPRSAAGD